MFNLLNFAAVPFNSPTYERKERGKGELREEVMMEVMRELVDRESHISRLLFAQDHSTDSPGISSARRQNHISRLPLGATQKEPALTCLVLPDGRRRDEEETRGCNGGLEEEKYCRPPTRERGRVYGGIKMPVAASLICLLLLLSLAKR